MIKKSTRIFAAILLLNGAAASSVHAQEIFATPARSTGDVSFASATQGAPILAGNEVIATGKGFQSGQIITLTYGNTPLPTGQITADSKGEFQTRFKLPTTAATGTHAIVIVANTPYGAKIADLKISPIVPLSGTDRYDIKRASLTNGLYQSAHSAKSKAIFVASAVGRPPINQSELIRVNADTLAIEARATPAGVPQQETGEAGGAGVFAVYGVGVDDNNGTVWATNTRQNTVAVYRQADLSLVKQFAPGTVNHARDVVIDSVANRAFVSATMEPEVAVFDTKALAVSQRIAIQTKVRGEKFSAASLSLDAKAHKLYVVSNTTNEVAVINTSTNAVENVFPVPHARSTIGVSHDPQTGRIYVAAQGSDNLIIMDGSNGSVVADTPVGAGALNVLFDPKGRRVYVTNRGASTITVTDPDGKIIANLGPAPQANHVSTDGNGTIYAVTKGLGAVEDSNSLWRIRAKR